MRQSLISLTAHHREVARLAQKQRRDAYGIAGVKLATGPLQALLILMVR
jgi:hypothetical protein